MSARWQPRSVEHGVHPRTELRDARALLRFAGDPVRVVMAGSKARRRRVQRLLAAEFSRAGDRHISYWARHDRQSMEKESASDDVRVLGER